MIHQHQAVKPARNNPNEPETARNSPDAMADEMAARDEEWTDLFLEYDAEGGPAGEEPPEKPTTKGKAKKAEGKPKARLCKPEIDKTCFCSR